MTTSYKQTIGNTTQISEVKPTTGTYETITLSDSPVEVPSTVTAIQFIAQLSFEGIAQSQILAVIDTLPEPHKTLARVSYDRAATFDRSNALMSVVGQAFGKSDLEMDEIFIKANKL